MKVDELHEELTRINKQKIFSQKEKESLSIGWVKRYAEESNISFDEALDQLDDYANQLTE